MRTRRAATGIYFAIVLAAGAASADEQADARVIVDKAIDFAGGREALARYEQPFVRQIDASVIGANGPEPAQIKQTTWLPDGLRSEQTTTRKSEQGQNLSSTYLIVFDGNKGWTRYEPPPGTRLLNPANAGTQEMSAVGTRVQREQLYAQRLTTLLPLDDKAFHLSTVAEIVVDGRAAAGVNIAHEDRPDVQLYFDKETFAPVKLSAKVNDRDFEQFYDDYGDLDGLVYPRKIVTFGAGKKLVEMRITELKFVDAVDDDTFDKP